MSKIISMIICSAILVSVGIFGIGCTPSDSQIKLISNLTGRGAALAWISYDNPSIEQRKAVIGVLNIIKSNSGLTGTNSYVEVYYPIAVKYIDDSSDIKPIDKVLVKGGVLGVLSGIDIMFSSYPKWKTNTQKVEGYVIAFIDGAIYGLELPDTSEEIITARRQVNMRVGIGLK
jgi:amino acid permease